MLELLNGIQAKLEDSNDGIKLLSDNYAEVVKKKHCDRRRQVVAEC